MLPQVRMQIANLQNASSSAALAESLQGAGAADHGGMRHVLRRLRFLYRGSLPPLMTAGLVQSLNFSGFEAVKRTLHPDPLTPAPLPVFWAAGCGGTLLVTLITCPSQRIKIQQQSASKGIGMLRCVSQIVNTQVFSVELRPHRATFGLGGGGKMCACESVGAAVGVCLGVGVGVGVA